MSNLAPTVARVTDRITERSKQSRARYLALIEREAGLHPAARDQAFDFFRSSHRPNRGVSNSLSLAIPYRYLL